MGLKILHSADWHLDTPFSGLPQEQRTRLKQTLKKLPGRILEIAHGEKVDMVLLSGDLFDGQGSRESVDLMRHTLREFGVPVFISPGNHDFCRPGSPWLETQWPENVHIFTRDLEAVEIPELDCRVYGAGYQSMDCPALLRSFQAEGEQRYCVAVLHGDPISKQSPCCPVTAAEVRESGLDYLALGHIHKAGSFRSGSTLCAWPGCPMGRGWDETGSKGVYLVTLEDGAELRWIPVAGPRFYDLEADIGIDPVSDLEALLPAAASEDFYRITLTGYGTPDLEALGRHFSHIPNLELRDRTQPPLPLWEDVDEDSLRGTYFRLLKESQDPHAALAAEISRRLLSGWEVQLP